MDEEFSDRISNDKTAQVGAGMAAVGAFGKAAAITKGIAVTTAVKGGVIVGALLNPYVAIGAEVTLIGIGIFKCLMNNK